MHCFNDDLRRGLATLALVSAFGLACDDTDPLVGLEVQVYSGTFSPMNGSGVGGLVNLTLDPDGGDFSASVDANGTDASITHAQHIHFAAACPTTAADANADGFVDVIEGIPSYGKILVPLDADLSVQGGPADMDFPESSASGAIDYFQRTSLDVMLADLRAADPDPDDAIVKLGSGGELDLAGRTVVLHGVAADTDLPATVQTLGTAPRQATLPIACATLDRVD
ncbi:MAG: hypothetical protein ACRENI_05225 [Gemmatimonadaceae bacterium]